MNDIKTTAEKIARLFCILSPNLRISPLARLVIRQSSAGARVSALKTRRAIVTLTALLVFTASTLGMAGPKWLRRLRGKPTSWLITIHMPPTRRMSWLIYRIASCEWRQVSQAKSLRAIRIGRQRNAS